MQHSNLLSCVEIIAEKLMERWSSSSFQSCRSETVQKNQQSKSALTQGYPDLCCSAACKVRTSLSASQLLLNVMRFMLNPNPPASSSGCRYILYLPFSFKWAFVKLCIHAHARPWTWTCMRANVFLCLLVNSWRHRTAWLSKKTETWWSNMSLTDLLHQKRR